MQEETERIKEHTKKIQIEQKKFYRQIFGLVDIQYDPVEYPTPDMAD